MNAEDRSSFGKVLLGLASVFNEDLTPAKVNIWWRVMAGWRIEDFSNAASQLLTSCRFMPRPVDFMDLLKKSESSEAEAWKQALQHARGNWRTGSHDNDLVQKTVVLMGGWRRVAMCNERELDWRRKEFVACYRDVMDKAQRAGQLRLAHDSPKGLLNTSIQ